MELLNNTKEILTESVILKVSQIVGLSIQDTITALDIFLSGLITGFVQKANSPEGINQIQNIINQYHFSFGTILKLDEILEDKKRTKDFLKDGSNNLDSLFSRKRYGILELLLKKSDLNKSNGTWLINFITPIVFSEISNLLISENLNKIDLNNLFANDRKTLLIENPKIAFLIKKKPIEPKQTISYQQNIGKDKAPKKKWLKWLIPFFTTL